MDILWKRIQKEYDQALRSGDKEAVVFSLEKAGNDAYSDLLRFAINDAKKYKNLNATQSGLLATNLAKESLKYYTPACGSIGEFAYGVAMCANRASVRNPKASPRKGTGLDSGVLSSMHPLLQDVLVCEEKGEDSCQVLPELTKEGYEAVSKLAREIFDWYREGDR